MRTETTSAGDGRKSDRSATERPLLDALLEEQQCLTAVDRFARDHAAGAVSSEARYYRDLIPATLPQQGQQYAFEVDLDRCSGCKACVSACHSMNGLDEDEMWRNVGLLYSQDWQQPFQQTVTTACHHCLDPGCLNGCPVLAYDKDPVTGIVRHLDDQCIGCQYCIMKCPYDVPKYSASRGIVRKCDMCANRLAANEAPACVQACPTEAIRIVVADFTEIASSAHAGTFLPEAPDPGYTAPSTRYKSNRPIPKNLAGGDHMRLEPSEAHLPLVLMLVLSQLAVGASLVSIIAGSAMELALIAAIAGALAPAVASFHLGTPLKAWRAFLGWRTSWFSREVIVFGMFAPLAALACLATWSGLGIGAVGLRAGTALIGLLGVTCSAMIYVDTRREFWRASLTFGRFIPTTILLGAALALALDATRGTWTSWTVVAALLVFAATASKLSVELRIFRHLVSENAIRLSPLNKSARLLEDRLGWVMRLRVGLGILGGLLCPVLVIPSALSGSPPWQVFALTAFPALLAGELLERYLFFTAVAPVRMPGGIAAA
ncbi:MAG TPA: DmsC/YnfH family molybdoenzyme membrane anchor subunit [Terriglobia bacterium]|nr:DmsC/YnfH family molybdoenzyme membrane anchor subunit [Terriglobia bacterium]